MDQNIQDIFTRIKERKNKLKELKSICKEMLDGSQEYKEVSEQLKTLRDKRKRIISIMHEQCADELIKIEDITIDILSDQEMLTDMAMAKYTKGESIELKDEYDNTYEPVFTVKFKRQNS